MGSDFSDRSAPPIGASPEFLEDATRLLGLDDPRWLHACGVIAFRNAEGGVPAVPKASTGAGRGARRAPDRIVYASPTAERLLNLKRTGGDGWRAPADIEWEKVWAAALPVEGGGAGSSRPVPRVTAGEREVAIEVVALPTGVLSAEAIAIVRDVTDTRTTLARIESLLGQFTGFMRSAPMVSFIKDERLRYVYVNPAYESHFGLKQGEILGKTDHDFRPSAVAQRLRENDQIVLNSGHALQSIDQVPGPNGGKDSFLAVKFRFRDSEGRAYVCGSGVSITAQVRAEEEATRLNAALREQMAENKLLLETLPVGIAVARDPACSVIEANPLLAAMLGIEPANNVALVPSWKNAEGMGRGFRILRDGEEVPPEQLPMSVACSTGKPVEKFEATAVRADGRSVEIVGSAAPLLNADGSVRGAVGAFLDVSEQRRLQSALLQANKMESIGRLAGGVAHDFNNLLTAVMGFADLIDASLVADGAASSGEQAREHVRGLRLAAEQAAALTRQLLAFARKQPFASVVIAINDLVREQEGMIRRLVGERVRVRIDVGADGPMVKADPVQVQQVLMSLAANARDAIVLQGGKPAGGGQGGGQGAAHGELVITSTVVHLDEHAPECLGRGAGISSAAAQPDAPGGGLTPGKYVRLDVRDTGRGISTENRTRLFEPFFTTKPRGRGTGLGLATAYGIMRQHGGTIGVSSEIGAGATFHLYFPLSNAGATAVPGTPAGSRGDARAPGGGTETVLLVEDEPLVMDVAMRMLSSLGYRVIQAHDGASALAAAQRHTGEIALMLSDVVMPDMHGPELADRFVEIRPKMRVLFMSGYPADIRGRMLPAKQFRGQLLLKPFTIDELAKRVRAVLSGEAEQAAGTTP